LGEQGLVGLRLVVLGLLLVRQPAAALEVAHDAAHEEAGDVHDVLVRELHRRLEAGRGERAQPCVDAVEEQRVEVQVQVERATESLSEDHRARTAAGSAGCLGALRLTIWSKGLEGTDRRSVICSGGGPGIMEVTNRGASEAKGENIGLNISLPFEQADNPYITKRLAFEFHYFFMRKYWFTYLSKAIVVMPGGFGTFDEFMEVVTLVQTFKIKKRLPIVLFGTEYWDKVLNLEPMVEYGTISPKDVNLFYRTDSVDDAYAYLVKELEMHALKKPATGSYLAG